MDEHWGLDVAAPQFRHEKQLRMDAQRRSRGGLSGNSPDALLQNLFITGAAEEEKKALAQPQPWLRWGQIEAKEIFTGGIELTPTEQGGQICRLSVSVPNN